MRRRRWFLPAVPDLLGVLREQVTVTVEGLDAFAAWAGGEAAAAQAVRDCEHRADAVKAQLHQALREAFVTPLEPEDLFALSQGIDSVLNQAKDTIGEAEVMACPPDPAMAQMATHVTDAVRSLAEAVGLLGHGDPFPAAAAAIKSRRRLEHVYRREMGALLDSADLRREIEMRELYRRCARIGDAIVDVAERIQYASVKEG
jgi:uncharacterized protein Yka (UPF0111/DUF47 family)